MHFPAILIAALLGVIVEILYREQRKPTFVQPPIIFVPVA